MTDDKLASLQDFFDGMVDFTGLDPDAANTERQLILNWSRKGRGFGMLSFFDRDGYIECDNEAMGRAFCRKVLLDFVDGLKPGEPLPPLLARFQTVDALLDASRPTHGREGGGW